MDPTRLLEEDDSHFEARLLRTARQDDPPPDAANRAAVALGLSVSAGAVATGTATAVAKAATGHAAAAHTAGTLGAASLAKWVGIGVVSGLVVTGGARYASDPILRASLRHADTAGSVTPGERADGQRGSGAGPARNEPAANPGDQGAVGDPLIEAARTPPSAARALRGVASSVPEASAAPPAESARVTSLSSELAVLERARHALVARDPDLVLRELGVYSSMPHTEVLEAEAEMLAIEALVQRGDTAKAKARATRALAAPGNGPHAARLREIVAAPDL